MLILDAHVHIYECFDLGRLFDCAWKNLSRQAEKLGCRDTFIGMLLLADRAHQDNLAMLHRMLQKNSGPHFGRWSIAATGDPLAITISADNGDRLYLLQGRQIVSSEGLEVLSLASAQRIADGLPINDQLAAINGEGALAVLPWGFGKWLGARGKLVNNLSKKKAKIFLGDNGGRPFFIPSRTLQMSRQSGTPLLSGSDALPIPGEEERIGSFGVYLDEDLDGDSISLSLRMQLKKRTKTIYSFGEHLNLGCFLRLQYTLRRTTGNIS